MKKKTVTQAEEHHFRWTDDSLDRERRITAPVVARRAKSLLALSFASQSVGCGASNRCSSRFRSRRRPVVSRIFFPHCLLASKEQVCAIFATVAFRDVYQVRGRVHGRRLRVRLVQRRTYINIARIINKYS